MRAFEMLMKSDVRISYQTPRTIETRFNELEMELDRWCDDAALSLEYLTAQESNSALMEVMS